jgi:hypothetical protein
MKNMGGFKVKKVKMELGTQKWENEANDSKNGILHLEK